MPDMGKDALNEQSELKIIPKTVGKSRVLTLRGRLTADSCELFRAAAVSEINGGAASLVIDISSIETLSSCGIGTLVWIDDDCRKSKCKMQLVNHNPQLGRLLALTGLDRQLKIAKSLDTATHSGSGD
jgi:anti-anti-sigma factor